jgi:peptide/nickel transport system substrate-binding protein
MSRGRWSVGAVTLVLVVLGAGCAGDSGGGGGGESEAAGPPQDGGTVTMATWAETQSLDPRVAAATGNGGGAELAALYDTIMRYDPESGEFEPQTAESLTPNDDFTQWTLKLRPGIRFSDGTPYDSAAVVANLRRHVEVRSRSASLLAPIESYDTPDDRTVVFTLSSPWNGFPYALASGPGMVVSPTATRELGDDLGTNPVGAGAGPFVLDRFLPGESLTMTRNPDYWGDPPHLDGLEFVYAGTDDQTYEAFRAGSVQAAFLRDPGAQADAEADGAEGYSALYSASDTVLMNNDAGPASDVRIRRAVAAAIDLDTLNQRAYRGEAHVSTDLISDDSEWYSGVDGPAYDIDQARDLVEEVKSEGEWDGSIRVSCHSGNPDWGTAVSGMLEAAGFEVDLNDEQDLAGNIAAVMVRRDFDLACFGSSISDAEPFFALNRDFNSQFAPGQGGNYAGYVNPDVDEAIAEGRSASSEDDIRDAISRIAEAYASDVPFLALASQPETVLLADGLEGVRPNANTVMMFDRAYLAG